MHVMGSLGALNLVMSRIRTVKMEHDVEMLEASITVRELLQSIRDEQAFPRLIVAMRHAYFAHLRVPSPMTF
jgi:hypothetical protein